MNALILVDLQSDFMPGGALAVAEGDQVVAVANRLMPRFDLVVATQDWHPANHKSFASQHAGQSIGDIIQLHSLDQVLWPDHCVQDSAGARFHRELKTAGIHKIVPKGTDREIDSYSGFFDNGKQRSTGLNEYLIEHAINDVFVMGLATDYCVKFTALDAAELGFNTTLIADGCRGVELKTGDVQSAIDQLQKAGVKISSSEEVKKQLPATIGARTNMKQT